MLFHIRHQLPSKAVHGYTALGIWRAGGLTAPIEFLSPAYHDLAN
jgi:hypothetical protein